MLENIRENIGKLIAAYESERSENVCLKEDIERLRSENEDYRKQIQELKDKIDKLNLTGAFVGAGKERTEAKAKVDKLIKEIDRCMALLEV